MRPICAVLRIPEEGAPQLVNISTGGREQELARSVVESSARVAADEMDEPGVYRLRIDGETKKPKIAVTRIAESFESVAVATVHRDGDESVAIKDVKLSVGHGAELDDDAVENALTEGVASCVQAIPVGEERAVEIVIPD